MSGNAVLKAIATRESQVPNSANKEFDDLLIARSHVPWHMGIQLIADATGLPAGRVLATASSVPLAGSLARRLGHASVKSFVTAPANERGLDYDWNDFNRDISAFQYMRRYSLTSASPERIISTVESIARTLGRPPEDAAEFHRVLGERMNHARSVERTRRQRLEKELGRERDNWQARAEQAESAREALKAELAAANETYRELYARFDTEMSKARGDLVKVTEAHDRSLASLEEAHYKIEDLRAALDDALDGRVDELFAVQDEMAELKRALQDARVRTDAYRSRYEVSKEKSRELKALCERRAGSIKRALESIREMKEKVTGLNQRVRLLALASAAASALALIGWILALV